MNSLKQRPAVELPKNFDIRQVTLRPCRIPRTPANQSQAAWLADMAREMQAIGAELGAHSAFAPQPEALAAIADAALPDFAGGNGRYRYAKAVQLSQTVNAVLTLAPRYENTAMILEMRGLHDACKAPLFNLSLDNDWDETAWCRLRSFLYYC